MWIFGAADAAASGDGTAATVTTLGAVIVFVGFVGTFMKVMLDRSGANQISAAAQQQIKDARADEVEAKKEAARAYRARDDKAQEAEQWRQRYETERDRTRDLEQLVWRLRNGTATNDES